jgi:hypothetical protein
VQDVLTTVQVGTSAGWNNPSTAATDSSSGGTQDWTDTNNIMVGDSAYSSALVASYALDVQTCDVIDHRARIIKGGVIGTTDKANGSIWSSSGETVTYGGSSDTWGLSWTPSDINNSGFGFALSARESPAACSAEVYTTYYLKATNFGFSIPTNGTIQGIQVSVDRKGLYQYVGKYHDHKTAQIDTVKITIFYSIPSSSGSGGTIKIR